MKRLVIGLTAVLVLSLFAVVGTLPVRPVEAGVLVGSPNVFCDHVYFPPGSSLTFDRDNTGAAQEHVYLTVTDGAGTVVHQSLFAGSIPSSTTFATYYYFSPAPAYNPITARLVSPAGGAFTTDQVLWELEVICLSLPGYTPPTPGGSATPPAALPGCDLRMPITSSSVVGAFVADAAIYSAPGTLADPLLTIEAGKTAWVLGQDESETYYKIVWGCSQFWVQKSTLGPNYDRVWQGAPLPTGVVS